MRRLFDAAAGGRAEVVFGVLSAVDDAKKRISLANAALRSAAAAGHAELLGLLLDYGASPNRKDGRHMTALMYAAIKGHVPAARVLLTRGSDPDIRTAQGATALMMAAGNNRPEVVRALLEHGADPRIKSRTTGETALMMAARSGCLDAAALLVDLNAPIEDRTIGGAASGMIAGLMPLMLAAANGQSAIVELLLSRGADANARDENGNMASWWAAQNGHAGTAALLVRS